MSPLLNRLHRQRDRGAAGLLAETWRLPGSDGTEAVGGDLRPLAVRPPCAHGSGAVAVVEGFYSIVEVGCSRFPPSPMKP